MPDDAIAAESSALTEDDLRKRDMVRDLIQSQNKVLVDFAKHLLTVSFTAIGVVLALKDKWLGNNPANRQELLLGVAIALFLAAGLAANVAASSYNHRVSLADYADVEEEIHRVASRRYWLTNLGFGLSVAATILVAVVTLSA